VRHRYLDHREAELSGSRHHLRVHEEPAALRQQLRQRLASEHLQRTIDVANAGAEQRAGHAVVAPGEEAALQRIFAVEPVSRDDGVFIRECRERAEFGQFKLTVGVREGDQREPCGFEARSQSGPVALVEAVANQSRVRGGVAKLLVDACGVVEAAVVDDENLELVESPAE